MSLFNLSLDDFSPRHETDNLYWANKLIEVYPEIKIDLFVSAAYARLGDNSPFFISNYPKWIDDTKKLSHNYRINLHGFFHRRCKSDWKHHNGPNSNNNEWENLTYDQASLWLDKVVCEFKKAGIKHRNIFRAPGWHISKEAVRLLNDRGFIVAGNDAYYNKYKGSLLNIKWISYNWDLTTLCPVEKGDVLAYGHTSNWTNNYMDEDRYNLIIDLLTSRNFYFGFLGE